jgi:transcriptional regulator with PAS, ATPase and Fis domain
VNDETTERESEVTQELAPVVVIRWVWPTERVSVLQGKALALGRDEALPIQLAGQSVSRLHAELYRQGPLYAVRDLASTNGTWQNGRRVEHAIVNVGDWLRFGDWVGMVRSERVGARVVPFGAVGPGLFGSEVLASAWAPARRAANSDVPIVLQGATGTGKELAARAIHELSGRRGAFFAVNCAAIPQELAEAELFGYRRGAFTGAERASGGYFRAAHGGTLFLDEVAELPLKLQSKLLRVLEERKVLGLGDSVPVPVDVRVITAAQISLETLVERAVFRQDLAARLCGLVVSLPPLSARPDDIVPLFLHFLRAHGAARSPHVDARLIESLCLYGWPQNVRELLLLTRLLLAVHGEEPLLRREHLPERISNTLPRHDGASEPALPLRSRGEHDLATVRAELQSNGGSVKSAAERLGISRQRIYRLLAGASDG